MTSCQFEELQQVRTSRYSHIFLQIVGSALVVLAIHWYIPFAQPSSDAALYFSLAQDLRFGEGVLYRHDPETSLFYPPGYPWLLSLSVERGELGTAPFVQRLYHGLTISIGSIWATVAFGVGVGWLVFGLLAINPALIGGSSMLASEVPHLPLYVLGFLSWFGFVKTRKVELLLLSGACLAFSAYLRAYGFLLVLFVPALLVVRFWRSPWRLVVWYVAVYLSCWAMVLAPWTIRNYLLWERFVPMTIKGGYGLYSSWTPDGPMGMLARDEVFEEASKIKDPFERNRFYERAAIRKVLSDPWSSLETLGRKYVFYLMPFDWEFFGRYNAEGKLRPSLHFVYLFLMPFVTLYIWQHRRDGFFWIGLMAPVLYGLMMTGIFVGLPRFRLCIEPFLTVYAAAYLAHWTSGHAHARIVAAGSYFLLCAGGAYVFSLVVH